MTAARRTISLLSVTASLALPAAAPAMPAPETSYPVPSAPVEETVAAQPAGDPENSALPIALAAGALVISAAALATARAAG